VNTYFIFFYNEMWQHELEQRFPAEQKASLTMQMEVVCMSEISEY
jgi:hypothetical protein